ncbi:MAG: hypothetical protein ACFB01_07575 [Cohaesibacteraceae bacterium]
MSGAAHTLWHLLWRGGVVVLVAALLVMAPAHRASGFLLDILICEMDRLTEYCLAKELLEHADAMEAGIQHDLAVVYSFAAWNFSAQGQEERDFRAPSPSAFADRMDDRQASRVIWAINRILHQDDTERGLEHLGNIRHHVPRMIAYPMVLEAMRQAGVTDEAETLFASFETEIAELPSEPARIFGYGELAWSAARAGYNEIAERAIEEAMAVISRHPSEDFQLAMAADLVATEHHVRGEADGAARLDEALAALERQTRIPDTIRAETLARIARAYGRMDMQEQARSLAQQALTLMATLPADRQVRVYAVLVFSGIY